MFIKDYIKDSFNTWITGKNLDIVLLSSTSATFILDIIEKYKGAFGFFALFVLTLIIRIAKAKQAYRHKEEEHDIRMKKLEEK